MKYFLDTEFLEGTQKQLLGDTKPTIDLISIGMVCENGREYYAISKDFNLKEAWNRYDVKTMTNLRGDSDINKIKVYWIRDNVLKPIWIEFKSKESCCDVEQIENTYKFTHKEFKKLINKYGKTNKQIAEEIKDFIVHKDNSVIWQPIYEATKSNKFINGKSNWTYDERVEQLEFKHPNFKPEFYADYCNYDWVVFCWLFGKMKDLPKHFPYYCNDLQQLLKFKHKRYLDRFKAEHTYEEWYNELITLKEFPINRNEHNALSDAKYCKDVYNFINKNKDIDL